MVTVGQLMRVAPIIIVEKGATVKETAEWISGAQATSALIIHKDCVVGIVTQSDIVKKVVAAGRDAKVTLVETIMSSPLVEIEVGRPIGKAYAHIEKHKTSHLGVTKDGKLVGTISVYN